MDEQAYDTLQKALIKQQYFYKHYSSLAVVLIIFAWLLYAAVPRFGFLMNAVVLSIGIFYYPFRHYRCYTNIKKDLENGVLLDIDTFLYAKKQSNINRLQAYYYFYTEDETFEVDEALFHSYKTQLHLRIQYAKESKTIIKCEPIKSS